MRFIFLPFSNFSSSLPIYLCFLPSSYFYFFSPTFPSFNLSPSVCLFVCLLLLRSFLLPSYFYSLLPFFPFLSPSVSLSVFIFASVFHIFPCFLYLFPLPSFPFVYLFNYFFYQSLSLCAFLCVSFLSVLMWVEQTSQTCSLCWHDRSGDQIKQWRRKGDCNSDS